MPKKTVVDPSRPVADGPAAGKAGAAKADAATVAKRVRRTQEERSTETRMRLALATLELLSEIGYERISTTLIAKRAGVSSGALMHHFPTKIDLLLSAFEMLLERWDQARQDFKQAHAMPVEIGVFLRVLWTHIYSTPDYVAAVELMLAARGDADLRTRLHEVLDRWSLVRDFIWQEAIGFDGKDPQRGVFLHLNMCLLRGMALHASFNRDQATNEYLLEAWIKMSRELLGSGSLGAGHGFATRPADSSAG